MAVTPSQANQLANRQERLSQSPAKTQWITECIDCDKRIFEMTNKSLMLDASGNPHIAYGGDHLYYAWFDGAIWQYETVDIAAGVGGNASLALDQNGYPHISYHDRVNNALKYAFRDASGWHTEIVDSNPGDTGVFTSIALDQDGLPHISYYAVNTHFLRYAYFDGTDWHTQAIDQGGIYGSLALDPSGVPHVSYRDITTGELRYASLDVSGWITETVDSNAKAGSFTALVFDDSGYPHLGYFDEISGTLKYAYGDANGWNLQDLGDGLNSGYYLALEISPDGLPWISYYDAVNGDLKIGYWQGSTWYSSTVDTEGDVGGFTSLEFNQSGDAFVAYAELFCYQEVCGVATLKLAQQSGSDWLIQTVDRSTRTGGFSSLKMDSTGTLHTGYLASTGSYADLRHAVHQESGWLITSLEGTGELGNSSEPSMVLNSEDKPRFSYTFSTCAMDTCSPAGLIYAELEPTGLVTQTVDVGTGNGTHSSLELDAQDYPHISYYDGGNLTLKYAYMDAMGWHTETVTATTITTTTLGMDLVLDEQGYPHIVYNHAGLRYAYKDVNGWHFAAVDDTINVYSSSLVLDADGNARVAYQDTLSQTLKYAVENQGAWNIEIISGTLTDGYISLALDALDVPYITYHGMPDGDLMLTHHAGSDWTHEVVDGTGDTGKYTSLVVSEDGSIYISYYDATNGDLRLARYTEANLMFIPCLYK